MPANDPALESFALPDDRARLVDVVVARAHADPDRTRRKEPAG